jgi:hypothetical protein
MLRYKAELEGIRIIVSEESYISKCSFLDLEPIGKHAVYAGSGSHAGCFARALDAGSTRTATARTIFCAKESRTPSAMGEGVV